MCNYEMDISKTNHYYFFMKVGNANCFLKYSQQLGGLWVGYDLDPIPNINSSGLVVAADEEPDLRYMTYVSQEHIRKNVRVVSYGKDNLHIYEITGPLQYLKRTDAVDWSDPDTYATFPRAWWESVKEKLDGIGSPKFLDAMFGECGWKLLPAKLIASIPRSSLIAPIDSLSVWQSFNRRTFQPMFTLKGSSAYSELGWLEKVPKLEPLNIAQDEVLEEGQFGRIIRLYLDSKQKDAGNPFGDLPSQDITKTIFAMLNPAQVETIALHLCTDLKFTVDVGLGKGLDVADVKGTVRHLSSQERATRIRSAISTLEIAGVRFSEKLRTSIEATSSIRFQCKARPTEAAEDLGTVLLIEPGRADSNKKDTLVLESLRLSDPKLFPTFHDWLAVLRHDLTAV